MNTKLQSPPLPILDPSATESRTMDSIRDRLSQRRSELAIVARAADGPGRLAALYANTLAQAYGLSRPLDGRTILASPSSIIELILSLEFGVVTNWQM
ncbi:MAG: hypothetical protein JNM43_28510 [Planctomycetaceae bacterium]|nr:hypothetical protein [Planctomycetaceae bacterium]